ncbi:ETX/MTX2 family pore-forming toxin [Bacillus cereus]|uniref:Sulfurtransferase n=1 Tax=Bacillus cereus TaxID=1396 RepID=A0A9X7G5E9_BACCE|nr:ETX/MTX2 family pore-forming toxin [Bacillus cereus]PED40792.1 sulfurtransferase [Bacillus cereus]PFV02836.1 sulfurtransferase [Bacillus cereus]
MKLKNKVVSMVAITSLGAAFTISDPGLISAASINSTENSLKKTMNTDAGIVDWQVPFKEAAEIIGKNYIGPSEYLGAITYISDQKILQHSVEADGSPEISKSESIFVGKTILTNNSNQEQTLSTNSFSKTISNSITNATTHGFKFGSKVSSKFQIPLVGETAVELNTEYNFSDTTNETKSVSHTYTAGPQNIKVPANSAVEVIVKLDAAKIKGNVKLLTEMTGKSNTHLFYKNGSIRHDYDVATLVREASRFEELKRVSAEPSGKTVNLIGYGKYEAEYGTEFSVTVKPINKKRKFAGQNYTFKVKPEITK